MITIKEKNYTNKNGINIKNIYVSGYESNNIEHEKEIEKYKYSEFDDLGIVSFHFIQKNKTEKIHFVLNKDFSSVVHFSKLKDAIEYYKSD